MHLSNHMKGVKEASQGLSSSSQKAVQTPGAVIVLYWILPSQHETVDHRRLWDPTVIRQWHSCSTGGEM